MRNLAVAACMALAASTTQAQFIYTQSTCEFAPMPTAGTTLCLFDDAVSAAIPLGFTFNYYGTSFTNCYVGSNGFLTFNAGVPTGCCGGQVLPNASYPNTIFFAQSDLNPNSCAYGTITYYTTGTAGAHVFVLSFTEVPHFPGPANFPVTVQLQLHESGEIRIVSTHIPNSGTTQTMGLNLNGATATLVDGRNSAMWSAENECIAFNAGPSCIPGVPTGLFVDNISATKVKVHWSPVAGVDKYNVSVYTIGGVLVVNKMTTATENWIKDLTPGTDYAFKVKSVCVDEGTQSAPSAPCSFTTLMRLGVTDDNITLFPNPSNGQFTLNLANLENEQFELQVINQLGQAVYTENIDVISNDQNVQIDLGNIPSGMYSVTLTNDSKNLNYQIMVNQ